MQMVVCSQYQFPPPGAANALAMEGDEDAIAFSSDQLMLEGDAELMEEEMALAAMLRGEERQSMRMKKKRSRRSGGSLMIASGKKRMGSRGGFEGDAEEDGNYQNRERMRRSGSPVKRRLGRSDRGDDKGRGEGMTLAPFIFLRLDMAARKPPPDVLEQLKKVDEELGIGARFRRSTEPDFVAASIAGDDSTQVSRSIIENSIGWLAPAVAAEPDVTIKRLPMGCICHMLMMSHAEYMSVGRKEESGNHAVTATAEPASLESKDASQSALLKLTAPLQKVVVASLFEGDGSQDISTIRYFMEELRSASSQRRAAARRALESILALKPDGDMMDVEGAQATNGELVPPPLPLVRCSTSAVSPELLSQAERDQCSWVFHMDRLPAFKSKTTYFLRSLFYALEVEGSHHVISYYLTALHCYCHSKVSGKLSPTRCEIRGSSQGVQISGDLATPSFFSFTLCHLLSTRKLIMSSTAQRFPTVHELMVADVISALDEGKGGQGEGKPSRLWGSDRQVRYIFPGSSTAEVLLPESLVIAGLAILAMHTSTELSDGLKALLALLFPDESCSDKKIGAGHAVKVSWLSCTLMCQV